MPDIDLAIIRAASGSARNGAARSTKSYPKLFQLPVPLFESPKGFTRTVLFAHKDLKNMNRQDRIQDCYLHACLCYAKTVPDCVGRNSYVTRKEMTNTTLRARFGVEEHNRSLVSRLIREAVDAGAIVPVEPDAAPKLMRYLPFWAAPGGRAGHDAGT